MIIECPSCQSKFNLDDGQLTRDKVKLRCRICSQVFVYEKSSLSNLEQEFENLLTESESAALLNDQPELPPAEAGDAELQTEVATATEGATDESEASPPQTEQARPKLRRILSAIALLLLLAAGGSGGYYYYYHYYTPSPSPAKAPIKLPRVKPAAPLMTITQGSLTYELLPRENGESVLVIRGTVKRLSNRAVSSVLLEAKLYDEGGQPLETKQFYAGIVPQKEEFISQSSEVIDSLLLAEPAAGSPAIALKDIPFALAFFGASAKQAATAQIEVKTIQWQATK